MQMPRDIGPFHIIGIGGIGMSAIAEILLAKGYTVQGSDQKDSANVQAAARQGHPRLRRARSGQPDRRALRRDLDGGEAVQPGARRARARRA